VRRYFFRRLLYAIPTLLGISLLAFLMLQFVPGDPALLLAGQNATTETVEQTRRDLGLDRPLPVQYVSYVANLVRGDFGQSFVNRRPVGEEIARRYPRTLILAGAGIAFALVGGVALGALAALRPYSAVDHLSTLAALTGISLPGFWLGLMLIWLFSVQLRWLPTLGLNGPQYVILPGLTISLYTLALVARMTRAGLLDVLAHDYIRTARAKGLADGAVVLRHALKNALMPVLTVAGVGFGHMLGTAVVVEVVFSIDGIGRMIVEGILNRDMPVVQSGVIIVAANFVLINLALDVLHGYLDPRVRL
jgi:peptide/nickel transport system permease protein